MHLNDCTFCKIIAGKLPSAMLHEDEICVAFLPRKPINPGHVLVASRTHYESYIDMPDAIAHHLTQIARNIGQRINKAFKPKRVGFSIVGFEVAHVHIHVIPLYKKHEITSSIYASINNSNIEWTDREIPVCAPCQQAEIIARLKE